MRQRYVEVPVYAQILALEAIYCKLFRDSFKTYKYLEV